MMRLRITVNLFAPWVVWPLASYSERVTPAKKGESRETLDEQLTITLLFLAIAIARRTLRPAREASS
jgi:hypothetical protein